MKNKFPTKEIIDLINTGTTEKKKENDEKNAGKTQTQDQSGFGAEKKSLYDSLDKINADYEKTDVRSYNGTVIPRLDEKTYDAPTDEEIVKTATEEEKANTERKKRAAEAVAEEKKAALNSQKENYADDAKISEKRISDAYETAKNNAADEAIKRGIARSSIISEQLKGFDEAKIRDVENAYAAAREKIAEADDKIGNLTEELLKAVASYDIEEAVKINERITALKEERTKKQNEVTEYNNALKEKRAKTLSALGLSGMDLAEEKSDEYVAAKNEKLQALYKYYGKAANKKEFLQDAERIRKYVGNDGFEYLSKYIKP